MTRERRKPRMPKHFQEASENLERMQATIAPFARRRKVKEHSTAGEWCETSCRQLRPRSEVRR